ncbi:MAG TPA: ComEC/Rec2 family competence protein, partial [Candidatus Dormibacteraeota bacterium]|nr:ComEC/Rec2 family competence protein [Candidatus Dormibacteraeota bacterium]
MNRYPALVLSLAWSIALAATVVLAPAHAAIGAAALAVAVPMAALALAIRPALIALAFAVVLLGVARAELPAVDPSIPARAAHLAGVTVAMAGRVADDSHPTGGGAEVLVDPTLLVAGATVITDVGNLMVRWRGPTTVTFGDEVVAAGRLMLPRDLPAFDRRAYLAQRFVYLELQASSFDVTRRASGIAGLPGRIRRSYTSTITSLLPAPHAAVLLGVVLGIREGMPASLQQALIATGLIHLLVLSGLKVAVFARIVQGALTPILGRLAAWPAV